MTSNLPDGKAQLKAALERNFGGVPYTYVHEFTRFNCFCKTYYVPNYEAIVMYWTDPVGNAFVVQTVFHEELVKKEHKTTRDLIEEEFEMFMINFATLHRDQYIISGGKMQ